jgi:hypothetical protein
MWVLRARGTDVHMGCEHVGAAHVLGRHAVTMIVCDDGGRVVTGGHVLATCWLQAHDHMRRADLVVVWGSSLGILANYFDPWCPTSKCVGTPVRLGRNCVLCLISWRSLQYIIVQIDLYLSCLKLA